MSELEQLKRENDELRASLMKIKGLILSLSCDKENNSGHEPSLSVYQRSVDDVIAQGLRMQCQDLADIRADAVDSVLDNCAWFHNREYIKCDDVVTYGLKLRNDAT